MADSFVEFEKRVKRIDRKHRSLARGYTSMVGKDGLLIVRAKKKNPRLPIKGLAFLAIGFLGFKGLMLAHLGTDIYSERIASLNAGTFVEKSGAWVMQADPATQWIAGKIGPFLR